MFYYGYNAYDSQRTSSQWGGTNKLHYSDWSSDVNNLKKFLSDAKPSGGSAH